MRREILVMLICWFALLGHSQSDFPEEKSDYVREFEKKEQIRKEIAAELGDSQFGLQRVQKCDLIGGNLWVIIVISDSFTRGLIEDGWWRDAWDIIKLSFYHSEIRYIKIVGQFPVRDAYGRVTIRNAAMVEINRQTYNKIERRNFMPKNLPLITKGFCRLPDQ